MLKTQKRSARSCFLGGLIGIAGYVVVALVAIFVTSMLVVNDKISSEAAQFVLLPFAMVASYIGSLIAGLLSKDNVFWGCIGVLAVVIVFRMILTLFTYDSQIGDALMRIIPDVLGSALAVLTIAKKSSKGRIKKVKKRYL